MTYQIVHPASVDDLLEEEDFEHEERLPYWAELWPSAVALARYLSQKDLSGKRAAELGCGVGLPTVVALDRGALVLATDHNEAALDFVAPELADLVPGLLAPGGECVVADPRRPPAPSFLELMEGRGFRVSTEGSTVEQDGREVKVLIHRFRHGNQAPLLV